MMLNVVLLIVVLVSFGLVVVDWLSANRKRTAASSWANGTQMVLMVSLVALSVSYYNFEYTLVFATLLSGGVALLDRLCFARCRLAHRESLRASIENVTDENKEYFESEPVLIDYAHSFFPVLILVLVLRSFTYEPFRIASGSLEPTLMTGNLILVNKYTYGLRLPVINKKILSIHEPKRGDIVLFHFPVNHKVDFIKRLVGVPGDKISYHNKVFTINGVIAEQKFVKEVPYTFSSGEQTTVKIYQEDLLGVKHNIYRIPSRPVEDFDDIIVPEGMYFMVGDNRDDSDDSRYWGYVSESEVVGRGDVNILAWEKAAGAMNWQQSLKGIH